MEIVSKVAGSSQMLSRQWLIVWGTGRQACSMFRACFFYFALVILISNLINATPHIDNHITNSRIPGLPMMVTNLPPNAMPVNEHLRGEAELFMECIIKSLSMIFGDLVKLRKRG
jgi:hypothetical protein